MIKCAVLASLPQPDEFGWEKREDEWIPVMISKTFKNIETDGSLFQNSNKGPFFSRFIVQPPSHAVSTILFF